MTYDELREAVARAMNEAALKARTENPDIPDEEYDAVQADAAVAVVREALRDSADTEAMRHLWREMLDASPLGGGYE